MKKNVFALSVAAALAGLAGSANAGLVVNPNAAADLAVQANGIGHILLVPYFTTQNGNSTLLSIVNTDTVNGKALKVRFRGARNSDDVYDFTLFLSPGDVWTANVSAEDGRSVLNTTDTSRTLPANVNGAFIIDRANNDAAQTREGYIEILNGADIPPSGSLYAKIKHVNGVVPTTSLASEAVDILNEATLTSRGYAYPTGGLLANWVIVDTANGASHSGAAVAVAAETNGVVGQGNFVVFPQTNSAVSQAAADLTADPLLTTGAVAPLSYDYPDLSTPYVSSVATPTAQANSLSAALSAKSIINEFATDEGINYKTDWVFSLPTRRYGVAYNYANNTRVLNAGSDYFTAANTILDTASKQIAISGLSLQFWDREERSSQESIDFVISPGKPGETLTFPGEVTVLSFLDAEDSVLSAAVGISRKNIGSITSGNGTALKTGWLSIDITNPVNASYGLPVIGYAVNRTSFGNLGATIPHRWIPGQ